MTFFEGAMLSLQLICCGESLGSGMWWKSVYWGGAFVLTLAVVKGLKA